MAILFDDQFLEDAVRRVQTARADTSPTKTARDLLREKLTEMGVMATGRNAVGGLASGPNGAQAKVSAESLILDSPNLTRSADKAADTASAARDSHTPDCADPPSVPPAKSA